MATGSVTNGTIELWVAMSRDIYYGTDRSYIIWGSPLEKLSTSPTGLIINTKHNIVKYSSNDIGRFLGREVPSVRNCFAEKCYMLYTSIVAGD